MSDEAAPSAPTSAQTWVIQLRTCSSCNREAVVVSSRAPTDEELAAVERLFGGGLCTRVRVTRCEVDGSPVERAIRDE